MQPSHGLATTAVNFSLCGPNAMVREISAYFLRSRLERFTTTPPVDTRNHIRWLLCLGFLCVGRQQTYHHLTCLRKHLTVLLGSLIVSVSHKAATQIPKFRSTSLTNQTTRSCMYGDSGVTDAHFHHHEIKGSHILRALLQPARGCVCLYPGESLRVDR